MRRVLTRAQQIAQSFILSFQTASAEISSALKALETVYGIRDGVAASIEAFNMTGDRKDKMTQAVTMLDDSVDTIHSTADYVGDRYALIDAFLSEIERKNHDAGIALRYYYIEGKSYEEIARELNISSSTVYRVLDEGLDMGFWMLADDPDRWVQ